MPFSVASFSLRSSTFCWASVRLRATVRCGNSSKCWNTMPMRARSFGRLVLRSPTEVPSTLIVPSWKGSSPLTHLINVDLPEPEGPHTTTTSPLSTLVVHLVSTWKVPNHLLTACISIMAMWETSTDDGDALLQAAHQAGRRERAH